MNGQDVMNALNHLLDLGDTLDNAGGGVQGLTDGRHTTREVCKLQLGQFLLYIADGCPSINDGQAAVLNLVFHEGYGDTSPEQYMEMAKTIDPPDPSSNLTLLAFKQGDMALSAQNGNTSTSLTDILINTYEAFGKLMVAMNESFIAQSRYDRVFNQLKAEANQGSFGSASFSTSGNGGIKTTNGFVIDSDVLTKYEGHSTSIEIPDGVKKIDDDVFSGMDSLEKVVLPRSIRVIGTSAFRQCEKLKSIDLPEGLTEIEYDAFTYCESLTCIDIPSTVKSIGGDAFCFCNNIKKIRIPASLTDIGDDAFMYCNGLETVVVYGGSRSNIALSRMKEHFPDDVKIIWDGEEQNKPKGNIATKKTTSKTKKASSSGKYDKRVSFDLPKGYEFVDETDDDGKRTVQVKVNPSVNDDGETVYENTFMVNIQNLDGSSSRKPALDIVYENNVDAVVNKRLAGKPEALVTISSSTSSIFGVEFSINLINLGIALSNTEVLALTCVKPKVGDEESSLQTALDQMKVIWDSMTLDGNKVITIDMDIDGLMSAVSKKADADKEKGETPIDNSARQVGTYIEVGNRWRMELPYGMRMRYKKRGDDDRFDELNLDLDRRTIGHCFLGTTLKEHEDATQTILLMLSMNGGGYQEVIKSHLRNDDYLEVLLGLRINGSGNTAFEIVIKEKLSLPIETRILLLPPYEIEDMKKALESLNKSSFSLEHPFGDEWEQYWKTAVRMAASVMLISETEDNIELSTTKIMVGDISLQIPDRYQSLAIEETEKVVYLPTTKKPTRADLKRSSEYPYCILQESEDLDWSDEKPEDQSTANHRITIQKMSQMLERNAHDALAVPIHESLTDAGYKAIYLVQSNGSFTPEIMMFTNDGKYVSWLFHSDSGYSLKYLLQIARRVFDTVHCNNDREIVPIAYPQVPDICHEHLTLTMGGGYTTRRDADFIGQPIRMLMEKCGNTKEEAYTLMSIPEDDYSLDTEARRLAKVFRLDEGLFDPYTDTEAMIHLGMFADVKMFHALRSLSWTVSCKADREGRQLETYKYEELIDISKPIETNHFNYSTESYCSGLCSHYDWRVFYVPDAYIDSDCESSTDLRQLCGKENRSGNSTFVFMGGLGGLSSMNRTNEIISRNEETLESLEALRKDLTDLLPVMKTIYNGLMKDRDRSQKLEGVLADALTAWCAIAVAAREPFYSEEANDNPEVDAGLSGPMEQPTDDFEYHEAVQNGDPVSRRTALKRPQRAIPNGDVLDLSGATVIAPGQFAGNMSLKNIIIPEGVTEIGDQAFNTCMFLETVVLPKTLKKIGKMAFMSCRSLRQVEIPEGVEEICDHAFGATNNLKEVYLPDSLQRVDRYIFGLGGDSPYATAYMSGSLATRLLSNSKGARFNDTLYARRYVIDGVGYEDLYDYGRPNASEPSSSSIEENKSYAEYCAAMEQACKEGKTLQEMIEVGRKTVNANMYADQDAFEQAIKNIDRDATVSFSGKHFVLTGFGSYEDDVIAEIEKQGGIIHSSMVKMADYLIVCLEGPGASKVKKALEWRQKGAKNHIVSDYQMWQAILGEGRKKPAHSKKPTPSSTGKKDSLEKEKKQRTKTETAPKTENLEQAEDPVWAIKQMMPAQRREAYERYLYHGDIIIKSKYFSFSGFGKTRKEVSDDPIVKRIEDAGAHIDSTNATGLTDYFVIRSMEKREEAKLLKAVEMIERGGKLKMVLLEDVERALDSDEANRKPIPETDESEMKKEITLDLDGATIIKSNQFSYNAIPSLGKVIIPEGVVSIEQSAFSNAKMVEVSFPSTLRTIGIFAFDHCQNLNSIDFKEGIEEIGFYSFSKCPNLLEVHLPDSLKSVDRNAFVSDDSDINNHRSEVTLYLSGKLAEYLDAHNPYPGLTVIIAKAFVIDGKRYSTISDYVKVRKEEEQRRREAEEHAKREQARREREEADRKAAEARKKAERDRINEEIFDLTSEMNSLRGLFAGMKRKKLQKRIDELNEQLRRQ